MNTMSATLTYKLISFHNYKKRLRVSSFIWRDMNFIIIITITSTYSSPSQYKRNNLPSSGGLAGGGALCRGLLFDVAGGRLDSGFS